MSEQIKKRRGRPSKQAVNLSGDLIVDNNTVASDPINLVEGFVNTPNELYTTTSEGVLEQSDNSENISEELNCSETDKAVTLCDKIAAKKTFENDNITWTPHKFNIGDTVWVPQEEVLNTADMFSFIKASLQFVPKKFTVATVVFTNKVSYTFKETSKVIASENYVCKSLEQCAKLCSELN
jgi:hypothetical protein